MRRNAFRWRAWAGLLASAALAGMYARGGQAWVLGFVILVPWILALEACATVPTVLRSAWVMAIAFSAGVFGWFGMAIGAYTGVGAGIGVAALLALAPLLQPQLIAFALVRHWLGSRHGPWLRALAGASAWVACEWLIPRLFDDSLGHGLYPSPWLRQFADLGGVAGITFLLIFVNEFIAIAISRHRLGAQAVAIPLIAGIAIVGLMAGYGAWRLSSLRMATGGGEGTTMRIGMVQSNIYDYERLRREMGAYEVVRHVLDTHYALSREAIDQHHVDALLWSETVYPTTFGHPKSDDGAALDHEIQGFVASTGIPLVFGTYDLDKEGEYNAAAFLDPTGKLLGFYRKTDLFPLTERVPHWLDGPVLRRALPWAGSWQPGDGARVFPLRTRDGREVPVLALICRDDVDTGLARDGARLGAQLILGMSNDSWFTDHPAGANLHLAVAAFRSVETRMPQVRVTANGISAVIDATGAVTASTRMGEAAVLVGEVSVREPPLTLLVALGDWVGRMCFAFLALLGLMIAVGARRARSGLPHDTKSTSTANVAYRASLIVLTPAWRIAITLLKFVARATLVWMGLVWLFGDGSRLTSISGIRMFLGLVAAPELAAWGIAHIFSAIVFIEGDALVLEQRKRRIEIPLCNITALEAWRCPLPMAGAWLRLASGTRWSGGIALADVPALARALELVGATAVMVPAKCDRLATYLIALAIAPSHWLDHAFVKFVLFPLLLALPAFRLHQHIAFGGTFGEYETYGLKAYLLALVIWWASWAIGLVLFAAALRVATEIIALLAQLWQPARAGEARQWLEISARVLFFLGMPIWWALRIWGG